MRGEKTGDKEYKEEDRIQENSLSAPSTPPAPISPCLLLMIGLPASGKSTLVQQLLAEDSRRLLISTDAIRNQLFGDEAIQGPWILIWREIQRQLQQAVIRISSGAAREAIYDATNARRRSRREVISIARANGFTQITGVWLNTPVWLCLARNRQRDRQVPETVIFRMHRQLRDAPPTLAEGLDSLFHYSPKGISIYGYCDRPISKNRT